MQAESEYVTVTKVVGSFQGFQNILVCIFMIFIRFVRDFTSSLLRVLAYFAVSPLESSFIFTQGSLAGLWRGTEAGAALSCRIPVRRLAGGEGKVGEHGEEVEPHLMVVLDGSGAAGRWVAGVRMNSGEVELGSGDGPAR